MLIDTYETPVGEGLLRLGRRRHASRDGVRRLLITEAAGAAAFVAAAGALAALAPSARSFSLGPFALTVAVYLAASRVEFPVGSAWTAPTQLVFVPMLFVLPTPLVPAIVAACSLADRLLHMRRGGAAPTRLLARVGDSSYALGPALVLVLAHGQTFAWWHWPLYAGALAAQVAVDAGIGLVRTWFAEGVRPSAQLPMLWLYVTDACLSCVGLLIAAAAAARPGLVLLALPLVGLMGLLGRERRTRLEYSLALTRAYDEMRESNEELHEHATLLARQNRDIERKNEEIELARRGLEEKAAQLALASKYKSEFLANVSHELRTPLNSMLLLSRLLAENERGSLSEPEVEFARTIGSAGHDLLALINDILDLSKVEAGRMELEFASVALADVAASAERAFRPLAQQKGLSFVVDVDPALPASIVTDRQRLDQVLRNLLSNAFKFTHQGGVALSIAAAREDDAISFTVSDTGVGIAEDRLEQIFEAFRQADGTTSRRYGGTGLGLSISREFARLLGGEIRVQSTPGEGSRFSLLIREALPSERPAFDPMPSLTGHQEAPDDADQPVSDDRSRIGPPDRILLVVDSDTRRARAVIEAAHERGQRAIVAADTLAALELAREYQPEAVVLAGDARRVERGLAELKEHPDTRHLPVVAIGGFASRLPALRLGAAAFVERSAEPEAVERALARAEALARSRRRRVAVIADPEGADRPSSVLRGIDDVEVVRVDPRQGVAALRTGSYDLAVMALSDRINAFDALRGLVSDDALRDLPVLAYVPGAVSKLQRARLDALAKAAVIAVVDSPERLVDRAALFLHRAPSTLPGATRRAIDRLAAGDAPLHGKTVLIIDDDIPSAFALTSLLERQGMKVVYAENGQEGLERLQQHPNADLVLLDVMMPVMDGYETATAIRALPAFAELPIIVLSADARDGDRDAAIAAGACDYIAKPLDVDRLLSMMHRCLLAA
jgi:signal transduction histidine kinase/CheY-like chemotaxis protein